MSDYKHYRSSREVDAYRIDEAGTVITHAGPTTVAEGDYVVREASGDLHVMQEEQFLAAFLDDAPTETPEGFAEDDKNPPKDSDEPKGNPRDHRAKKSAADQVREMTNPS